MNVGVLVGLVFWLTSLSTACVYLSPTGSDTTGNGTLTNPFQTISFAINYSIKTVNFSVPVELCFLPGEHTQWSNVTVVVDTSKVNRLTFSPAGADEVRLRVLNLVPKPSDLPVQGFTLYFNQVQLSDIEIRVNNDTNDVFDNVVFDRVVVGENENDVNWDVTAKHIELWYCVGKNGVSTGSIWLNSTLAENNSVVLSNLTWYNLTSTDTSFYIYSSNFNLSDSIIKNSTTESSLFYVGTSMHSAVVVNIRNVTFDYNQMGDISFFYVDDNSTININDSSFQCNIDINGTVLPFFDTDSIKISVSNISSSECPVNCYDNTLALNPISVLPCLPCGFGNGSVNFQCQLCPPNTYSMSGICYTCPIYSSQSLSGQDHCICFSHSPVYGTFTDRCNYEVWGIIVGLLYVVVILGIFWLRRPKKYTAL